MSDIHRSFGRRSNEMTADRVKVLFDEMLFSEPMEEMEPDYSNQKDFTKQEKLKQSQAWKKKNQNHPAFRK